MCRLLDTRLTFLGCVTCFKFIGAHFFTSNVTVSGEVGIALLDLMSPRCLNKINIAGLLEVLLTFLLLQRKYFKL